MLTDQIASFIDSHPNWSTNTIDRYRRALLLFATAHPDPSALKAHDLRLWFDSHGWGSSARYITYQAIRQFLRWQYGAHHPALTLKLKRKDSPPGRVLDMERAQQLMAIHDTSTPKGWRDLAIISLMLDTGMRCSEVCSLQLKRLDLRQCHLDVIVKGGAWSPRVYSDHTASYLEAWLQHRPKVAASDCPTVFCSIGGNTPGQRLTRNGMICIFRYWGERVGFHVSPHDLRRTMASLSLKAGAPDDIVMKAGGWHDPEVFRRYTVGVTQEDFKRWFPVSEAMK